MQVTHRVIKSKLDYNVIIVTIPEFGYKVHYKLIPETFLYSDTVDNNKPHFSTALSLKFIKLELIKKAKSTQEVLEAFKKKSIIPPDLVYDHILLGFVYADDGDPNNFRWWLDFRDNQNQSIYNYHTDNVEINCPITTKSWHDQDPNGIWHGRMVLSPNEVQSILEPKQGKLVINGKLRRQCKPLNQKNICSAQNIPEKTKSLRLRYNIREDLWFCDILDKKDKELGVIPCKNIICDAKMYGQILVVGDKRRVSTRININDISEVGIAINSLIIRGK